MSERRGFTPLEIKISNRVSPVRDQRSYKVSKRFLTGFTLVELLVVIAIIALLMSILIPALTRVRRQAKAVMCQSNLKQWFLCFAIYTNDNEGYFMSGNLDGDPSVSGQGRWWMEPLRACYKNPKIRCCPMATKPYNDGGRVPFGAWEAWVPRGGIVDSGIGNYGSYGPNGYICHAPEGQRYVWGRPTLYNWRTINIKSAANVPLILDCFSFDTWPNHWDMPPPFDGWSIDIIGENEMRRVCINRHNKTVNGAFFDSSVRKINLKCLWKFKWHRKYDTTADPPDWESDAPWMKNFPECK